MLNIKSDGVLFTFENGKRAGESYTGDCYMCSNATCTCNAIDIIFTPDNELARENCHETFEYFLQLNVSDRHIEVEEADEALPTEIEFAESLASELNDADWNNLRNMYLDFKYSISEKQDVNNIDAQFPMEEIESEGLMVCYHEILPYGEQIFIEDQGDGYFIQDSYCVLPECDCVDVYLGFQPYTKDVPLDVPLKEESGHPEILFNYKSRKWSKEKPGYGNSPPVETLFGELTNKYPNLHSILKQRHLKLKRLYKNYRREHLEVESYRPSTNVKLGRNEPCPCGSGKKYKNCCMEL